MAKVLDILKSIEPEWTFVSILVLVLLFLIFRYLFFHGREIKRLESEIKRKDDEIYRLQQMITPQQFHIDQKIQDIINDYPNNGLFEVLNKLHTFSQQEKTKNEEYNDTSLQFLFSKLFSNLLYKILYLNK